MFWFKNKINIVTHSGSFHADDCLACATLLLWAEKNNYKLKIIRSREPEMIEKAGMVVDVGMKYEPDKDRFDHHQKGGAGQRGNGIPYASFGLVWLKYGAEVCGDQKVADRIDRNLAMPVDAKDNGVNIMIPNQFGIFEHDITSMLCNFNPTSHEGLELSAKQFEKAVYFAKEIIKREIVWAKAHIDGSRETRKAINDQNNPEILILDKNIKWQEEVSDNKNIKFVVFPHQNGKHWCVESGKDNLQDFKSDRALLSKEWWNTQGVELQNISGIAGALFCANRGWFGTAEGKESAIKMALKSLQIKQN